MAIQTVNVTSRSAPPDVVTGAIAVAADVAGDSWPNTGAEMALVQNGSGSSITVTETFAPGATIDGVAPSNRAVTILANKSALFGPFNQTTWNDANGRMNLSYSAVTSVKICVFKPGTP